MTPEQFVGRAFGYFEQATGHVLEINEVAYFGQALGNLLEQWDREQIKPAADQPGAEGRQE